MGGFDSSRDGASSRAGAYAPRRRAAALLPVLAIHAAALGWIAAQQGLGSAVLPPRSSLVTFDVASPPQPVLAKPRARPARSAFVQPVPVIELPPATPIVAAPETVALTDEAAAPLGGCDLTETVQAALREDPAVRRALAAMPEAARSVANAVMLWDGRWIDGNSPAARAALIPIRDVVLATIGGASAECRAQVQAGPRLIAVPGPPDTTLALGSGRWRWDDIYASADLHPQADRKRS